jgi:hypothetical protein
MWTWDVILRLCLTRDSQSVQVFFFLSNSQKIWLPSLVWEILEDMTKFHILGGLRKERSCELYYFVGNWICNVLDHHHLNGISFGGS